MRPSAVLPWPPTANRIWRAVPGKGVLKSAAYRLWLEHARAAIHVQSLNRVSGAFNVRIEAHRPDRRRRDLDNLVKPALDALTGAGVIEDDSLAQSIHLAWSEAEPKKPGSLRVTLEAA